MAGEPKKAIPFLETVRVENRAYFRQAKESVTQFDRDEDNRTLRLEGIIKDGKEGEDFATWNGAAPMGRLGALKRLGDLRFSLGDWKEAANVYGGLLPEARRNGNWELVAWRTLQQSRSLAAQHGNANEHAALQLYELFLGHTEMTRAGCAPGALLRAGVLCAGPLNDRPRAKMFFHQAMERYPNTPDGEKSEYYLINMEIVDRSWELATQHLEEFLKRHPKSVFNACIREDLLPQARAKGKPTPKPQGPTPL